MIPAYKYVLEKPSVIKLRSILEGIRDNRSGDIAYIATFVGVGERREWYNIVLTEEQVAKISGSEEMMSSGVFTKFAEEIPTLHVGIYGDEIAFADGIIIVLYESEQLRFDEFYILCDTGKYNNDDIYNAVHALSCMTGKYCESIRRLLEIEESRDASLL